MFTFSQVRTIAITAMLIVCFAASADAAWRFDAARFQNSAHGDFACSDCHSDITEMEVHPNQANVNQEQYANFKPDGCYECHAEVEDHASEGDHYGVPVDDPVAFNNCNTCHDPHYMGAPEEIPADFQVDFSEEDAACMECHASPTGDEAAMKASTQKFCFSCHGSATKSGELAVLMNEADYAKSPHADLSCETCHPESDQYPHNDQSLGACERCHEPHDEGVAHDAHIGVYCESCHLDGVVPIRDELTKEVVWESVSGPNEISPIHNMQNVFAKGQGCERCHVRGNDVGAAAHVLPAKSVICMPCHTSVLTANDDISIATLAVFGGGFILMIASWLVGSVPGLETADAWKKLGALLKNAGRTLFSKKGVIVLRSLFYDVLLQGRLYKRSPERWAIHSLIFLPFVFRFTWGIIALILSHIAPGDVLTQGMLHKNNPVTAFLFDVTGMMILVGIVLAWRRGKEAEKTRLAGLPSQDRLALFLIGGIVVVGYILEGMRISMTGAPDGAHMAFFGSILSGLFSGMIGLPEVYGYMWYLHAILTGVFIAYLPFSKLAHMIMAPIVLAMNALAEDEHHQH